MNRSLYISEEKRASARPSLLPVLSVLFLLCLGCVLADLIGPRVSARAERREDYKAVTNEIAHWLKSPATARFSSVAETKQTDGTWRGWVDSQNSFGAMMRSTFEADVSGAKVRRLKVIESSGEIAVDWKI